MVSACACSNPCVTTEIAVADATSPRSMPPTPSATAKRKPWERVCWREIGMNDPMASSLFFRILPGSVAWLYWTSNIRRRRLNFSGRRWSDVQKQLDHRETRGPGGLVPSKYCPEPTHCFFPINYDVTEDVRLLSRRIALPFFFEDFTK